MKFSICIPNYNYARYLGRTIRSVLEQPYADFEVVIADNASTDESVTVARGFDDPRIKVRVNQSNVGFARNLDKAAGLAAGDRLLMLSSDDLLRSPVLVTYRRVLDCLGDEADETILGSAADVIDPEDAITGGLRFDADVWSESDRDGELSRRAGVSVYRVAAPELLRRCISVMKTPASFATTCYPRALYERLEGYGGGRLINPDKWFAWRLLGVARQMCFVDAPLVAYRWHPANQSAQQAASGALKYLVDEYTSTLELDAEILGRAGMGRDDVIAAFVEHDIIRHGLATLARGEPSRARRVLDFGRAVYPAAVRKNARALVFEALLRLGPIGRRLATTMYRLRLGREP